MQKDNDTVCL